MSIGHALQAGVEGTLSLGARCLYVTCDLVGCRAQRRTGLQGAGNWGKRSGQARERCTRSITSLSAVGGRSLRSGPPERPRHRARR